MWYGIIILKLNNRVRAQILNPTTILQPKMPQIYPSDILNALVVESLITFTRKSAQQNDNGSDSWPLDQCKTHNFLYCLVRFLSSSLQLDNIKIFSDYEKFIDELLTFISEDDMQNLLLPNILLHSENLDSFVTFMEEGLRSVFEIDSSISQNNLLGPYRVSESSSLGIFLRTVIAKWQALEFGEQCGVYDAYKLFISKPAAKLTTAIISDPFESKEDIEMSSMLRRYLVRVENSTNENDIYNAESIIHQFFDTLSQSPFTVSLFDNEKVPVDRALRVVQQFDGISMLGITTNQNAIISLAVMWLRAGNLEKSQLSVEEALKTAHQRGDHSTVAICLLLLFHIFQLSDNIDNCEDLLRRCIARAAAVGMHYIVMEAGIALATQKLRNYTYSSKHTLTDWTFGDISNILSTSLHGETSATSKFCLKKEHISLEDTTPQVGPAFLQKNNSNGATNNSEEVVPLTLEYIELIMTATLTQCELWSKMGLFSIASSVGWRSLTLFGPLARVDSVVLILRKFIFAEINHLYRSSGNSLLLSTSSIAATLTSLLKALSSFRKASFTPSLSNYHSSKALQVVDCMIHYTAAFLAMTSGEFSRAARVTVKMMQLLEPLRSDKSFTVVADYTRFDIVSTIIQHKAKGEDLRISDDVICSRFGEGDRSYVLDENCIIWLMNMSLPIN